VRLLLDAGALIGIERDDRRVAGLIELCRRAGGSLVTVVPVVGQAWRGGARQGRLARALAMIDVRPTNLQDAQSAGALLAESGGHDVVDALLVDCVLPGDQLLTSDPDDLSLLVAARRTPALVVRI
jgi:hypothetical protein